MCSICKEVLRDFGIEHKEALCPLRNSRYCSYCAKRGHLTSACPAKPPRMFREPCYHEQLIPPSDLKEKGITTLTPIKYNTPDVLPQLLKIKDNDLAITEYLLANSVKIQKGYTKRQILEDYAELNGMRVVYVK